MTWVDGIAAVSAAYACACLQLRAQALKPQMADYPRAPLDVRAALFVLSLVCGAYALTVMIGDYAATRTEAMIFAVLAWSSHVLWRNVRRQGRARVENARPTEADRAGGQ